MGLIYLGKINTIIYNKNNKILIEIESAWSVAINIYVNYYTYDRIKEK